MAAKTVKVELRGDAVIREPLLNKGTAFTAEERSSLQLHGLLPDRISTLEDQVERAYRRIARKTDPLERYIGLSALQDRNEHLFYRLLGEHVEEFLPIVYTPTVGQAAQNFSGIYRHPRGVWITPEHRGRVDEVLGNAPCRDVRLIVVTDNERILGLGDQGVGGMVIPVGKLALYTVGAGIDPAQTLPISLDVGTDNEDLLNDPLYLGWRQPRLRGESYDELVEEFVTAVQRRFPKALLQWEDFKKTNAMNLLARYRDRLLSFNDDIQGTAAVAVAGVLAGVRASGRDVTQHRALILGAGAAGLGIAQQLRGVFENAGVAGDDLVRSITVMDSRGLLIEDRQFRSGEEYKRDLSWPRGLVDATGLDAGAVTDVAAVVGALKPTILIGTSGQPGAFTEEVVRAMVPHADRPIIFPLSNPTSKSEAKPDDLMRWTDGRALVATGSPFDPVQHGGRTYRIGQGNNVFVFPGVGLGALVAGASKVTDAMFRVAAETLADMVTDEDLKEGALFPRLTRLREVSAAIAAVVVREAGESGVAAAIPEGEVERRVGEAMWAPDYPHLVSA